MSLRRMVGQAVALVLLGLGASSAGANLVTFVISGTVDSAFDPFHVGDAITLTYTIDTSVPGSGDSAFAQFGNVTAASIVVGGWSASSLQGAITRQGDDPATDLYFMDSGTVVPQSIGNLDLRYFQFELFDSTGTVVNDALIPVTHIDTLGDNALWVVFGNADTQVAVHGVATSIAVVAEPPTAALAGVGLVVLPWTVGGRMRRRRPG